MVLWISLELAGGVGAPGSARRAVLGSLGDVLPAGSADDVALLVSELVTNSVRYAHVGAGVIAVEVQQLPGKLRLTVSDPGGDSVPHLMGPELGRLGGYGLAVVDAISSAWGVLREPGGSVRVWCEIALNDGDQPSAIRRRDCDCVRFASSAEICDSPVRRD